MSMFDPHSTEPFLLSRSKLALFLECPRCFYLDRRLGRGRPDGMKFSLNLAVDALLKREFDHYRAVQEPHPLAKKFSIDAVPFKHPQMEEWRDMRRGIAFDHPTGLRVFGAIDDIWINADGLLHIVDYKATSMHGDPSLDGAYRDGYKRQLEIYQWLFRRNGFTVSDVAYFVFANARKDRAAFDARLEFSMSIVSYDGSDDWVEEAIIEAHACLMDDGPPASTDGCGWCGYRKIENGKWEIVN